MFFIFSSSKRHDNEGANNIYEVLEPLLMYRLRLPLGCNLELSRGEVLAARLGEMLIFVCFLDAVFGLVVDMWVVFLHKVMLFPFCCEKKFGLCALMAKSRTVDMDIATKNLFDWVLRFMRPRLGKIKREGKWIMGMNSVWCILGLLGPFRAAPCSLCRKIHIDCVDPPFSNHAFLCSVQWF